MFRKCAGHMTFTNMGNYFEWEISSILQYKSGCQEMVWKFCPILFHEMSRLKFHVHWKCAEMWNSVTFTEISHGMPEINAVFLPV